MRYQIIKNCINQKFTHHTIPTFYVYTKNNSQCDYTAINSFHFYYKNDSSLVQVNNSWITLHLASLHSNNMIKNSTIHFLFLFILLNILVFNVHLTKSKPYPKFPCHPPHHKYDFCNKKLSIPTRVNSLISLLTIDEKILHLSDNTSSIPRLGLPSYEWWSESLHGIGTNGPGINFDGPIRGSTSFPQVILTAATFNRSLWHSIAKAIAVEGRAMYNTGQSGLTFWAPNINVFRDPRWGRGQETPGEDPMVISTYAIVYVKGFQEVDLKGVEGSGGGGKRRVLEEDDGDRLMLSACCKHFTAYDLEKWGHVTRYNFNAVVTKQDMEDTFQAPFRSCIQQGKASCLMCTYNSVNGVPACADKELLDKVRTDWGFDGYITSDCDAVATIYEYHNYTKMPEDAVAIALKAGTNINCGTYMLRHMKSAFQQGSVLEQDLDRALQYLFSVQFRLGLFDGNPAKGQFAKFGPQDVCTSKNLNLALDAARQGIVLLKNDKKFLPLNKRSVSTLAIVGPMANVSSPGGTYTGVPCKFKRILEGFYRHVNRTLHAAGCLDVGCNSTAGFQDAISIAKEADYVIVVAGLDLSQEREDFDRYSLLLPGNQTNLVTTLAAISKKPIILVLTGGGPVDISFAEKDPRIASILWVAYPGETGGKALSEIIFGYQNPGGKLPMTWYLESFTKVPMTCMNMRADPANGYPGRTYRFYTGEPLYGFGHGLSFTSFSSRLLSAPKRLSLSLAKSNWKRSILVQEHSRLGYIHVEEVPSCSLSQFFIHISVSNDGDMDGSHVVLLFSRVPQNIHGAPQKQLVGFDRLHVPARESVETSLLVDPCEFLSFANDQGNRILALGEYTLVLDDIEHVVSIEM
ncbi:probable beta-D-xylosidase 6 [Capsicum annuum]|uniref:probable beta-D-xylosidase 6 n=1 Tax=Capsicum annuum TaxID=4072 RepID=UPI001FB0C336|nr:probable beta-D-xylosidase 6 [Capsicum annuum]